MAKYTTEVRSICEREAGLFESEGYNDVNRIINVSAPKIFNFSFPIFDENYRGVLEGKILKHFYTREIGEETVGLWKLRLDTTLNEIMPLYNKLYESELLDFNPLYNVDLYTKGNSDRKTDDDTTGRETEITNHSKTGTVDDKATGERTRVDDLQSTSQDGGQDSNYTNTHKSGVGEWVLESDTPQNNLSAKAEIEAGRYLTKATKYEYNDNQNGGVTESSTLTHGKTNTTKDTGSQKNLIDDKSTTTYDTKDDNSRNKTHSNEKDIHTIEDYAKHVFGNNGKYSMVEQLVNFRNSFINIDKMIIEELEPLFMQLW